jgi:uncharacterized coiled-coil protein SlyX
MTLEERMTRIENYFGRHDDMVRELRDAVTVTAQMEARQARALKDHTQWLQEHEQSIRDFDRRMEVLDERIANLVSGFGEYLRRHQ